MLYYVVLQNKKNMKTFFLVTVDISFTIKPFFF